MQICQGYLGHAPLKMEYIITIRWNGGTHHCPQQAEDAQKTERLALCSGKCSDQKTDYTKGVASAPV